MNDVLGLRSYINEKKHANLTIIDYYGASQGGRRPGEIILASVTPIAKSTESHPTYFGACPIALQLAIGDHQLPVGGGGGGRLGVHHIPGE